MGSVDSVPAAFELTVVDGRVRLSFRAPDGSPVLSPSGVAWAEVAALELEARHVGGGPCSDDVAWFQSRRLAVREAILVTDIARLHNALDALPFAESGLHDVRLQMGPGGIRMDGRFAAGNSEAPFTIRIAIEPRGGGPRRIRIDFADVRLFASLSVPGPLVGAAVARALGTAAALYDTVPGTTVRVTGAAIDVDPLELGLIHALVAKGWRLPDLEHGLLQSVTYTNDEIQMRFAGERPLAPGTSGKVSALVTGSITSKTAAVYARQEDADLRAAALGDLLQGFERLTPERQHDAYASFGRVAESTGDLEHAEEAYWRATQITVDAARRADDLVAHARVLLSRGNLTAAVSALEDAATYHPRHLESRRALAHIALHQRDLRTAAGRLEEVVRLLPAEEIASLIDTRQHLADIYFALSDWGAAKHHVELVLAHDPGRLPMLERLTVLQEELGQHAAAVDSLDRVARLSALPRKRAEALLRQGDILREHLGDEGRAFEAYLRSSDLDPGLPASALRLIAGYFGRGQFDDVVAVADDLLRVGPLPAMEPPLRLQLAMAIALVRGDAAQGAALAELSRAPWNAAMASAVLAEAAAHLSKRPTADLDPAAILLEMWRTMPNGR
jgi:tetratricopeptide (TPR) repeat protein